MQISFQLYSARNAGTQPDVFQMLARLGFQNVEAYSAGFSDIDALEGDLGKAGLQLPSAHVGLEQLEADTAGWIGVAKRLGIQTVYIPYLAEEQRPTTTDGYHALAERVAKLLPAFQAAGLGLGWHNHDFELRPLSDGSIPLSVLLDAVPDLQWEADLAWVVRADAAPADWVQRYAPRISAVHVKDIAPDGQNAEEDGWADLGEGVIEWQALLQLIKDEAPDALLILEHDNPSDAARFASRSLAKLHSLLEGLA